MGLAAAAHVGVRTADAGEGLVREGREHLLHEGRVDRLEAKELAFAGEDDRAVGGHDVAAQAVEAEVVGRAEGAARGQGEVGPAPMGLAHAAAHGLGDRVHGPEQGPVEVGREQLDHRWLQKRDVVVFRHQ